MRVPAAIVSAVVSPLAGIGLLVDDLTQIARESGRAVLVSASAGLAARIEDEDTAPAEVATRLTRAARLVGQEALLLPPLRPEPLVLPDRRAVSVWPLAVETHSSPSEVGAILRSLHDCSYRDLPAWDLPDELRGRSRELRQAPPGSVRGRLAGWIDELDRRRPPLGPDVPVHCDAHGENVMRYDVLVDLDGLALGPREYDLATWAVSQPRDHRSEPDLTSLVRAYGPDLIDPDVLGWSWT